MSLKEGALVAIRDCMRVKTGEKVLIVTDTEKLPIGKALFEAAKNLKSEAMLIMMIPREKSGEEPPQVVAQAMKAVDVVLAPTEKSISHTQARKNACEAGARVATLPGILEEMISEGGLRADYGEVERRAKELLSQLEGAKEAIVKSEKGTNLALDLTDRKWGTDTGICANPGDFSNLPGGEVYISPSNAQGVLLIDGSLSGLGLLQSPIKVTIKDGYAVSFDGKRADELERLVESAGEEGRNIAELGIGINPAAKLIGITLEDEKVAETLHVALGDDSTIGGDTQADVHLDGLITASPRLIVDGKNIEL